MSIKCKACLYEMTTCEFLGCLTSEMFAVMKGNLTRSISQDWDRFMNGFANDHKIECPICEKYMAWLPESVDAKRFQVSDKKNQEQVDVV